MRTDWENDSEEFEPDPGNRRNWIVALAVASLLILLYSIGSSEGNFAYALGSNMVTALIIIVAYFAITMRWRRGQRATVLVSLSTLFLALVVGTGIGMSVNRVSQESQYASGLRQDMHTLMESMESDSALRSGQLRLDTNATAGGSVGKLEVLVRRMVNRLIAVRGDYLREIEAIGWDSILAPQRLAQDRSLERSRAMIAAGRALIAHYQQRSRRVMDTVRIEVLALDIDEQSKQEFLDGYARSMRAKGDQLDTQWKLEQDVMDEFEAIITLLASKKRGWNVVDGALLFSNQSDLDTYKRHLAAIESIAQEQERVAQSRREQMNQGLQKLER